MLGLPLGESRLAEIGGEQAIDIVFKQGGIVDVECCLKHSVGEGYLLEVKQMWIEFALCKAGCGSGKNHAASEQKFACIHHLY